MTWIVVIGGLALTGATLRRLAAPISSRLSDGQPTFRTETLAGSLGQGVTLGILGGFRALAADFLWLRVQDDWEARDFLRTQSGLRLVTLVDPRPLTFWLNGARMIAYDMPAWRIAALADLRTAGAPTAAHIEAEQARMALAWLHDAEQAHPRTPAILIERANIQLNRLRDVEAAAANYRRAAELVGAPYYAARLHAELLRRLGRKQEAYEWLRRLHPTLPSNHEAAAADLVLARIRTLETELAMAVEQRYGAP